MFGIERMREKRRAVKEAERIVSGRDEMELTSHDVSRNVMDQMRGWKNSVETGVSLLTEAPHRDDVRVPFTLSYDTYSTVRRAAFCSGHESMRRDLEYPLCESRKGNLLTCISNAVLNEDGNVSFALSVVELEALNSVLRGDMQYLPELLDVNLAFARDSGRVDITYSETAAHPLITKSVKKISGW